jgi:MATE family multidrug resistance protein
VAVGAGAGKTSVVLFMDELYRISMHALMQARARVRLHCIAMSVADRISPVSFVTSARVKAEVRETLMLAAPLVLGQLSAIGMNVVDVVLAGHYNSATLAAVAVGTNIWSLALVTAIGAMLALPPSVAHLAGAGERTNIGALFRQAVWMALVLGIALFLATRHADPLLRVLGVDAAIVDDTQKFLHAISWGAPALAGYFALRGFSEGLGLTRPTMYFGFLGLVLLAPIGYALMYGAFGMTPRGAQGSGMATAIVLWLQLIAFGSYVALRRHYRPYAPFARFDPPRWREIYELLRISVPMGTTVMMEAGLFISAALLVSTLGATTVDSHQIAINVASITFMLPLGLAMATTVRVGRAAGAGDAQAVRYAGFVGVGASLLTQLVSSVVMATFPYTIAALYTADSAVVALAAKLLLFAAVFQFSDGIQVTANGALRGLKDTTVPVLLTVLAYWVVGMPIGYVLAFHEGLGVYGMWIGLVAGLTAAAVLLLTRFTRLARHWT